MFSFCTQFLVLMFASIVAKLHPIIWSCILLWVFSYKFLQYYKNTFFRTIVYDGFYKIRLLKILKQLLVILSKIASFHVKLAIKCIQTSRKEKFHKQPVVILFKNDCSVRHMFCIIFVYLWPKFLKIPFEVVHTYYRSFSRKIHIHMENLLNGYFYYSSFISNFLSRYLNSYL